MAHQDKPETLGRYQIVRELGKGAMGVVYEGLDPNIGRRVAIKTARRELVQSSELADEIMERFLREARAAGTLSHPNIVTIYDADEQNGIAYIAMEFLEGEDLQTRLDRRYKFTPEEAVDICATICSALAVAHDKGIVHRDIKPANIMVTNDGTIKLTDFGIARVSDSRLTQDGTLIGTPHYMSPEQFMGRRVDARSDLFSVGIILYELLTGEKPFPGEAISTVMHSVVKVEPVEPRELNFAVCECLSKVVMKALTKDPANRYQDGRVMAEALHECLKPKPQSTITQVHLAPPTVITSAKADAATVIAGETAPVPVAEIAEKREEAEIIAVAEKVVAPSRHGKKKYVLSLAAVLIIIGIGIGVAAFFMSSKTGPYYGSAIITIWMVDDMGDAYDAAIEAINREKAGETINSGDLAKKGVKPGTAKVTLTEKNSGQLQESEVNATKIIPLGKNWKEFSIQAEAPGYTSDPLDVLAPGKPDDAALVKCLLIKKPQ